MEVVRDARMTTTANASLVKIPFIVTRHVYIVVTVPSGTEDIAFVPTKTHTVFATLTDVGTTSSTVVSVAHITSMMMMLPTTAQRFSGATLFIAASIFAVGKELGPSLSRQEESDDGRDDLHTQAVDAMIC